MRKGRTSDFNVTGDATAGVLVVGAELVRSAVSVTCCCKRVLACVENEQDADIGLLDPVGIIATAAAVTVTGIRFFEDIPRTTNETFLLIFY